MWVLIHCVGGMGGMGSLWSVLDDREAELRGQVERLREQLAGLEHALARVVVARETYQELMITDAGGGLEPAVAGPAVVPGAGGGAGGSLSAVMRATFAVFQDAGAPLDARAVAGALDLEGTPAQIKAVRARLARLVDAGLITVAARGRYQVAAKAAR